ncbi:hypothetical protein B0A52_09544 [Exophiala mesophila]|uniref:Pyridoxamine 5'-phosphate oxidase putative domain-containing protein n=1 Tax=Exophiala mesophila TaxID=212818 RepID=A0A438MSZ9_EXOME|nr:hypothetical protein B0A52_09544 [Exophiala mesophila]
MVKFYDSITPDLQEWAMKQAVFFVASAPLHGEHINLSPKGLPSSSFAIINPNLCAYVDATGSGIETIAHLQENGRCTVMFCSFDTSPRIMRFFCKGRAVAWNEPGFDDWLKRMGGKSFAGARAVILLDVFKAQTSCGFGVPLLATKTDPSIPNKTTAFLDDRNTLGHWSGKYVEQGIIDEYRASNNRRSLDGLPGLRIARRHGGEYLFLGDVRAKILKTLRASPFPNILVLALVAILASVLTTVSLYLSGLLIVQPGTSGITLGTREL